jgi:hypothetical protein
MSIRRKKTVTFHHLADTNPYSVPGINFEPRLLMRLLL